MIGGVSERVIEHAASQELHGVDDLPEGIAALRHAFRDASIVLALVPMIRASSNIVIPAAPRVDRVYGGVSHEPITSRR
jgi:hypothetical protein